MRVAFDIHGVLDRKHRILPILLSLKFAGHTIIVVSGKPVKEMQEELQNDYGYDLNLFDEYYSLIDYVLYKKYHNVKIWYNPKGWWIDDEDLWWKLKSYICQEYNINVLIDDQERYNQGYLLDKFIIYNDHFAGIAYLYNRLYDMGIIIA